MNNELLKMIQFSNHDNQNVLISFSTWSVTFFDGADLKKY